MKWIVDLAPAPAEDLAYHLARDRGIEAPWQANIHDADVGNATHPSAVNLYKRYTKGAGAPWTGVPTNRSVFVE